MRIYSLKLGIKVTAMALIASIAFFISACTTSRPHMSGAECKSIALETWSDVYVASTNRFVRAYADAWLQVYLAYPDGRADEAQGQSASEQARILIDLIQKRGIHRAEFVGRPKSADTDKQLKEAVEEELREASAIWYHHWFTVKNEKENHQAGENTPSPTDAYMEGFMGELGKKAASE